jgi:hypothetical protein
MAMHINDCMHRILSKKLIVFLFSFLYKLLDSMNLLMKLMVRVQILSIEVTARKGCSVVPTYHTIRIDHRNYFEDKLLSQLFGLDLRAGNKVEEAMHHKGRVALTRMDSSNQHNSFLVAIAKLQCLVFFREFFRGNLVVVIGLDTTCDSQHLNVNT